MYEAMDVLYEHSEKVEEAIFFEVANLLDLDLVVDVVFYDTTTVSLVSFSIDTEDGEADDSTVRLMTVQRCGNMADLRKVPGLLRWLLPLQLPERASPYPHTQLGVSRQHCRCENHPEGQV